MKQVTKIKWLVMALLTVSSFIAYGYDDDKEKEKCRNPKIQEFTLPEYEAPEKKEVPAESEFSFVVSGWANPKKIKLTAKDKDIPFTVKSTETFHKIDAKIPAEFTGKFIRINARIPAVLGCYSTIGWLVKVADAAPAVKDAPVEKAPEAASPAAVQQEAVPSTTAAPTTPNTTENKVEEKQAEAVKP